MKRTELQCNVAGGRNCAAIVWCGGSGTQAVQPRPDPLLIQPVKRISRRTAKFGAGPNGLFNHKSYFWRRLNVMRVLKSNHPTVSVKCFLLWLKFIMPE